VLLVLPGDQIPADGIILDGDSACDEALMTGESHPVAKQSGDQVTAGSINIQGRLVMRAEQTGHATRLGHLISMMENAASEKPGIVLLADRHASRFLMIIMLVALISGLVWWQIQPERALWIAISVIVVTCPCALSLATPGVMAAAIGLMARNGLLVKSGKALQGLAQATHIVFDKTGTLTNGKLQVQAVTTDGDASTILPLALGMAAASHHPVARSVADYLIAQQNHQAAPLQQIHEIAGGGIEGVIDGQVYRFGQASFVAELLRRDPVIPAEWQGKTVSLLANANGCWRHFYCRISCAMMRWKLCSNYAQPVSKFVCYRVISPNRLPDCC
jgi:Cu2+-exporting ATPase